MTKPHWYAPFKGTFDALTVDPDEGPLFCVSFNESYAPFIRGAIFAMLQRQMWVGSDAELDTMRMRVQQLLYIFGQQTDCLLPADLTGEYEVMASLCESLRFQNGKLQALCCGEWVDIDGQLPGEGEQQPGEGAPVPLPGKCVKYHANLLAIGQWILPGVVNSGDVLTFTNPHGTAGDGSGSGILYCPAGDIFFAGSCTGLFGNDGADPAPAEAHMGTIVQIDGTWYGTQDPIVVPGGVANAVAVFQVNDSNLANNIGGYNFDVEHCNNAAGRWSYDMNFKVSPFGWSLNMTAITSGTPGHWAAGDGWIADTAYQGGSPEYFRTVRLDLTGLPSFDMDTARVGFSLTKGGFVSGGEYGLKFATTASGTPTAIIDLGNSALSDGDDQNESGSVAVTGQDGMQLVLTCSTATPLDTTSGDGELLSLHMEGNGPNPFAP